MKKYCIDEVMSILHKFPIVKNLARKKFVVLFLFSMIKARSVQFCEIAQELNDEVKASSNEVRIQDFFREVTLDYQQVALLLAMFLPRRGKFTLCIDRTEWDFGKYETNILMIIVRTPDIALPLYWELLDNNSGNSHTDDRIDLLKKCIQLLGAKRIGLFLGDREFIGHKWLKFLKKYKIRFCVRVPKHHLIKRIGNFSPKGERIETLLGKQKKIQISHCMVDGVWGNVYAEPLKDGDILYLFGTAKTEYLPCLYKKRWRIECFFQNVKKRGFDLEATHLNKTHKIKKLIAMVSIAYAMVANMGLHHHKKVAPIPTKNHGYKANSFARKGIDLIREGLRRTWKHQFQLFIDFVKKLKYWMHLNPNELNLSVF